MTETAPVDNHPHLPEATALNAVDSLRFEKSELNAFVVDDRETGSNIGKLLAVIFCVLVVLMWGVAWWTSDHEYASQDPFDVPTGSAKSTAH